MPGDVRVSVIVPMYNAERTIGATLEGVLLQTHRAIEVVVIDDGSTDASASIVRAYADQDPRIRLLRQPNLGVAAARNLGAASTDGEFLAFIDADDLWAPAKIAMQLHALQQGGPAVGLVYCWFAHIDEDGRVISLHNRPTDQGPVLRSLCRNNFIGNGSSMLLRRSAFEAAGGFDPSLRARGAQGCEDLLMALRVAERFEFRVVTHFLVGYRMTATNMSSDVLQMLRSCEIVLAEFAEKYPDFRGELDRHLVDVSGGKLAKAPAKGTARRVLPPALHARALFPSQARAAMAQDRNAAGQKQQGQIPAAIRRADLVTPSPARSSHDRGHARMSDELVSVVIPAHNAEATLDETLRSVRSQSHAALEIIVVDDGSLDRTAGIARRHCKEDARMRLIEQPNAGVAAARNAGWQAARAELIAFVDADELWAPTKIERQLAALMQAPAKVGLVYCWYSLIDIQGRVIDSGHRPDWRGAVLERLFLGNFVGNGSAALVRRQALVDVDGFDSRLHEAGAHGCEDYLFYCRVAERYEFEVVEEPLLGYRWLPWNMSSNLTRMLRSWMLVIDEMHSRHPDKAILLRRGLHDYAVWLLERALGQRMYVRSLLASLLRRDPLLATRVIAVDLPKLAFLLARRAGRGLMYRMRPRLYAKAPVRFPIGGVP